MTPACGCRRDIAQGPIGRSPDFDTAVALLQDADEGLIGVKQRHGDRINRVLDILAASNFRLDDPDEAWGATDALARSTSSSCCSESVALSQ